MQTMGAWRSETASGTRGGARLTEAFVRIITGFDPLSMARAKRKYLAGPGREPGFQDRQFAAASALLRRQQYFPHAPDHRRISRIDGRNLVCVSPGKVSPYAASRCADASIFINLCRRRFQ